MDYPDISPDFTLEDIRKIRDWSYERRKNMTLEEYNEDIEKYSAGFRKILQQTHERNQKLPKSA
jgi:hypothetical protein